MADPWALSELLRGSRTRPGCASPIACRLDALPNQVPIDTVQIGDESVILTRRDTSRQEWSTAKRSSISPRSPGKTCRSASWSERACTPVSIVVRRRVVVRATR